MATSVHARAPQYPPYIDVWVEYNAFDRKTDSNLATRGLSEQIFSSHLSNIAICRGNRTAPMEAVSAPSRIGLMHKLLVVCMGNICRSPMGMAVLQTLAARSSSGHQIMVDSAGTHASRTEERPDPRAEAAMLRRGYKVGHQRSRKVSVQDFSNFDLIFAMDTSNLVALQQICPPEFSHKLHLYLAFGAASAALAAEVPDPYYGNTAGFERVLDLCEAGATQILARLDAPQSQTP
jgi:protein-tyrosine phosphatase